MRQTRQGYQQGSLRKIERNDGSVWEFRYRDPSLPGRPQRQLTLSAEKYRTEAQVRRAVQSTLLRINASDAHQHIERTFGELVTKYIMEERLEEIKAQPPGEAVSTGTVKFSTACSYLSVLRGKILPRWDNTPLLKVKAADVQKWLTGMNGAPKSKGHLKSIMHKLFERAMLWEWIEVQRNPMELVEIRGISKRRKKPVVLTPDQFCSVLKHIPNPYRQMVMVAQCLGLRVSEILVLKWSDFAFERNSLRVSRAVVHGRIDVVKTEYSADELPLDEEFIVSMQEWRSQCPVTADDWVFPNPTTMQPYHASPIQQDYIRKAGVKAGLHSTLGWHTFRHTYRSLLDASGAPIGVQQKLMRHAQVSTTMDVYGNAQMDAKRDANSKVVKMVLRTA